MSARILIVVTHLLGTGHLSRALTLGRAFAEAGHSVHIVSGGFPAPHLDATGMILHQLPPLRAQGTDFTNLRGADGHVADDAYRRKRQDKLLQVLAKVDPDVLITELFPFGRRNLKDEFRALLEATSDKTRVFCSIRDILAPPSKPSKATFAEDIIAQHYDGVLVHADPDVIELSRSWPVTDSLAAKLKYTGFVAPAVPDMQRQKSGILVSAGGGDVGLPLFHAALQAARQDTRPWHVLVGGANAAEQVAHLKTLASETVTVEQARTDFRDLLARAEASVSLCGYNTAMDVLQTGAPTVFVPFDAGGEKEQALRASALADLPGIEVVHAQDLSGAALLRALDRAVEAPARDTDRFRFEGAAETVRICLEGLA
jgi:predicted glycosyltransferase